MWRFLKRLSNNLLVALALSVVPVSIANAASTLTQTFQLNPGWNAIYLEVQPEVKDPESVFAGIPIISVWTWIDRTSKVEFILDPNEGFWDQPGWRAYFPSGSAEGFLTSLYGISAKRGYLINLAGSEPRTLTITGEPSVRLLKWGTDSFTLVGLPVSEFSPPTFADFFASSSAHSGQAMYRLNNSTGRWEFIENQATTAIKRGEAYWVYTEGASTYQAPLSLDLPLYEGIDFGKRTEGLPLKMTNLDTEQRNVSLNLLPSAIPVPLGYLEYNEGDPQRHWPAINALGPVTLSSGQSKSIQLVTRREAMSQTEASSVLAVSDDAGILYHIPIRVTK